MIDEAGSHLNLLERQHEQLMEQLAKSVEGEEKQLEEQLQLTAEALEAQRRVYDDLEFQQLEVGAATWVMSEVLPPW